MSNAATGMDPIELYFWPTPNGWKITLFLEEAQLPYVVKPVNITRGEQFKAEFLRISPNNRMPAIVDPHGPDGQPISIFESGAILQYLGDRLGRFFPREPRLRVQVNEWLFWQVGGLGPMLGQANHFVRYAPEKIPYAIDRYTREAERLVGVLDRRLADREYLVGDYSIADMAVYPWVRTYNNLGIDLARVPNVAAWRARIEARPATERALAVGRDMAASVKDVAADPEARKHLFGQR
jgi:GST-like protein